MTGLEALKSTQIISSPTCLPLGMIDSAVSQLSLLLIKRSTPAVVFLSPALWRQSNSLLCKRIPSSSERLMCPVP